MIINIISQLKKFSIFGIIFSEKINRSYSILGMLSA